VGGVVFRLFPVALARGKHLFPFRTEQLSPSAPMVLGPQGPGRVGRRRFFRYAGRLRGGPSSYYSESLPRRSERTSDAGSGALEPFIDRKRRASHRTRSPRRPPGARPRPHDAAAPAVAPAQDAPPARGTAAQAPGSGPDACARTLCAARLGADAGRGWARPGRPPSRPRSRPRATGTSGPRVLRRARAAQACVSVGGGTCVRKVRSPPDGLAANMCTHRECE
jgi:hypothetical protein